MTQDTTASATRLDSVQAMRGVAALSVAAVHTSLIMGQPRYGGHLAFTSLTAPGWTGVNFFFVLSGFIILFAHRRDIGQPGQLGRYLWRRFVRVYPLYWLLLAIFVATALAGLGPKEFSLAPGNVLTFVTLFNWITDHTLPLKVAWTLFYEVRFYAIFALLILNRRLGIAAGAGWCAVILFDGLALGHYGSTWKSMWNIYFLFGGLCFYLYERLNPRLGAPILIAGIAMLAAIIAAGLIRSEPGVAEQEPFLLMVIGIPFALILLGGTLIERDRRLSVPRAMLFMGDASYAVYLVHSAAISMLCQILHHFAPNILPAQMLFIVIFTCAVSAGLIVHLLIERPLMRLGRRLAPYRRTSAMPDRTHGMTLEPAHSSPSGLP